MGRRAQVPAPVGESRRICIPHPDRRPYPLWLRGRRKNGQSVESWMNFGTRSKSALSPHCHYLAVVCARSSCQCQLSAPRSRALKHSNTPLLHYSDGPPLADTRRLSVEVIGREDPSPGQYFAPTPLRPYAPHAHCRIGFQPVSSGWIYRTPLILHEYCFFRFR
jgi:hypothetical protein